MVGVARMEQIAAEQLGWSGWRRLHVVPRRLLVRNQQRHASTRRRAASSVVEWTVLPCFQRELLRRFCAGTEGVIPNRGLQLPSPLSRRLFQAARQPSGPGSQRNPWGVSCMRTIVRGSLIAIVALAAIVARYADCRADWTLDAMGGLGVSDQVWHARGDISFDFEFESLLAWRASSSVGYRFTNGTEVGVGLGWFERGGAIETEPSVFRPTDLRTEFQRTYLDASIRVGQVFDLGPMEFVPGVSFRMGRLQSQDEEFTTGFEDWVLGLDPEIRLAYGPGFLWGQYPLDLEPSLTRRRSEMGERAAYFGLGWRIL